jgi:histidinol-phosphatase (PHP family)
VFSGILPEGYDYVIGSIHYIDTEIGPVGFDQSQDVVSNIINTHFGGDGMAFARKYFETLCRLPEKGNFDILGHFDLITKNNEQGRFIDTKSREYLHAGLETIHALKGEIPLFEVNTGAIARGYRTAPYPQMEFLKEFANCGFGAVITTDCHDRSIFDFGFEEAGEMLAQAGFRTKWILTDNGFQEVPL